MQRAGRKVGGRAWQGGADAGVNARRLQCFNVSSTEPLTAEEAATLAWLLRETYEPELLTPDTKFAAPGPNDAVVEVRVSVRISASSRLVAKQSPPGDDYSLIVDFDARAHHGRTR